MDRVGTFGLRGLIVIRPLAILKYCRCYVRYDIYLGLQRVTLFIYTLRVHSRLPPCPLLGLSGKECNFSVVLVMLHMRHGFFVAILRGAHAPRV